MTPAGAVGRRDPHYHDKRLRVALLFPEAEGHHIISASRCLLTSKHPSFDGKVILWFENMNAEKDSPWRRVAGRDGRIRIPVGKEEADSYLEGCAYSLYLWTWS